MAERGGFVGLGMSGRVVLAFDADDVPWVRFGVSIDAVSKIDDEVIADVEDACRVIVESVREMRVGGSAEGPK